MATGGGFVIAGLGSPPEAPSFTLYGDGTIVFQQYTEEAPPTFANGAMGSFPLCIAKLSEEQMQDGPDVRPYRWWAGIACPKY